MCCLYVSVVQSTVSTKAETDNKHTFLLEQIRFTLLIPLRESLNHPVDLLSLAREWHVHQQAPKSDIKWLIGKIEASHVQSENLEMKFVRAGSDNIRDIGSTDGRRYPVEELLGRFIPNALGHLF
jgi:hypothetical protein